MHSDLPNPTTPVHGAEPIPSHPAQSALPVEPAPRDDDLHGVLAGMVEYASWLRHLG